MQEETLSVTIDPKISIEAFWLGSRSSDGNSIPMVSRAPRPRDNEPKHGVRSIDWHHRIPFAVFCLRLQSKRCVNLLNRDAKLPSFEKNALNIADLRDLARKRLTRALFDFCDKGSEDQVNMRANRTALDNIKLMPRMLRDVSGRDLSITLFEKSMRCR